MLLDLIGTSETSFMKLETSTGNIQTKICLTQYTPRKTLDILGKIWFFFNGFFLNILGPNNHSISYKRYIFLYSIPKEHLQEKNSNFYLKINTFNLGFFKVFLILQNALNTFYNIYYDYWDLINKFWPGTHPLHIIFSIHLPKLF